MQTAAQAVAQRDKRLGIGYDPDEMMWVVTDRGLTPRLVADPAQEISWCAQPGSQEAFLGCDVTECLYEGTRGPGKTDALLADFYQHVGPDLRTEEEIEAGEEQTAGWGASWRGVLFRRTYPELQDVIDKSKRLFRKLCPEAKFNEGKFIWEFPDGEKLFFRHFKRPSDYWSYHGHEYPWIAWEELTTWPDDKCFRSMFSCSRSSMPGMPRKIRATTNPFGVGHNWVKIRYRLPVAPGRILGQLITDSTDEMGMAEPPRVAIHGALQENKVLLHADPEYISKLVAAAPNAAAKRAWIYGDWDIVAGGMFDDIWYHARKHCVVPKFVVPQGWWIDRSFDWGSAKPFSVLWWAESNGEDLVFPDGRVMQTVRGDLFLIHEWYGWNGKPNEGSKLTSAKIAEGIVLRELRWGLRGRVRAGPADSAIFTETDEASVAKNMASPVRIDGKAYNGVGWQPAVKGPGSRKQGWQLIRSRMENSMPKRGAPREKPGIFIVDSCVQWRGHVPVLPRDEKDPDDVDTEAEDHDGDATRYRLSHVKKRARVGTAVGAH